MKTFKEHLTEHSGGVFKRQWMDQDTIPSAQYAIEALNSYVGQMENHGMVVRLQTIIVKDIN